MHHWLTRPIATAFSASALAGLGAVAGPTSAAAATYIVRSCDDAQALPGTKADDAWQPAGGITSAFSFTRSCPSTGAQFSGQQMVTRLGIPQAERPQQGQFSEWRLDAPSGTTITRVEIQRDLGIGSNSYRPYGRTADGIDLDSSCTITGDNFTCDVGGPGTPYFTADVDTTALRWGIECFDTGTRCPTGATLHEAWAMIYGSRVTIDDPTAPTLSGVGGPLFSGGWKRGTLNATATASDTTGIKKFRWYRNGTQLADVDRTCDFSRTVPCTNPAAGSSVALDTASLPDGSHTIQLAALDAAGNETRSTAVPVDVDNTAPSAPTAISVTGGGASPSYSVDFTTPGGQASPIVTAHYRVCPSSGGCQTGSVPVTGASGTITGLTAAAGTSAISVWLEDEAGNVDPANAATTTVTYTPPTPPTPPDGGGGSGGGGGGGTPSTPADPTPGPPAPPTPAEPSPRPPAEPTPPPAPTPSPRVAANLTVGSARVDRSGRLIVRGRLSRHATGAVRITYRAKVNGARKTKTRRARIDDGRYRARLELPRTWSAHARGARVIVRFAGTERVRAGRTTLAVR